MADESHFGMYRQDRTAHMTCISCVYLHHFGVFRYFGFIWTLVIHIDTFSTDVFKCFRFVQLVLGDDFDQTLLFPLVFGRFQH